MFLIDKMTFIYKQQIKHFKKKLLNKKTHIYFMLIILKGVLSYKIT